MAYQLGIKPDSLKVFLYRDADFDSVLTRTSDDAANTPVPWGTSNVRLIFPATEGPVTWVAEVDEADASFQIDKLLTNQREHAELVELWVGDQCWAVGKTTKKGDLA